ncbi:hypothetical protein BH11PSE13_BH11PSE13_12250 [soil metagenome]
MTTVELQTRLTAYLNAEAAILQAQDYTVGQGATARRLTRADLAEVRKAITDIRAEISQLNVIETRARRVIYLRPY